MIDVNDFDQSSVEVFNNALSRYFVITNFNS